MKQINKFLLISIFVIILVFVGGFLYFNKNKSNSKSEQKITSSYTQEELAKHSTKEDCWLVVDNNVYDVTKFIPMHKGGDQILLGCGKDATELFKSNEKHGISAQKMLQGLQIGILAGS